MEKPRNGKAPAVYPPPKSVDHLIEILSSFTDYEKMESFHTGAVRCDLAAMKRLVEALGNPQKRIPCVHITGSKGKGSTAFMTASLLAEAGLRTGVYTSPHLEHLRERIVLDGAPVSDEALLEAAGKVLRLLKRESGLSPTFFEFITAAAMVVFAGSKPDVAVYEVGLGGRLDATNVVEPAVAVITNVELEHVPRLGTTEEMIAREKAGIIKRGVPVVTSLEEGTAAREVIEGRSAACGAPFFGPGAGFDLERKGELCFVRVEEERMQPFVPPRPASLQAGNAACALAAFHLLAKRGLIPAGEKARPEILTRLRLPGRFEVFPGSPTVVLDGAHSPRSIEAAAKEAKSMAAGKGVVALFGLAKDKSVKKCLKALLPHCTEAVFVRYKSPRSLDERSLADAAGGQGRTVPAMEEGLALARRLAGSDGIVLVTGSFYGAGEARTLLTKGGVRRCG